MKTLNEEKRREEKSKLCTLRLLAIVALVAVIGLGFSSCGDFEVGEASDIKITGLSTDWNGKQLVLVVLDTNNKVIATGDAWQLNKSENKWILLNSKGNQVSANNVPVKVYLLVYNDLEDIGDLQKIKNLEDIKDEEYFIAFYTSTIRLQEGINDLAYPADFNKLDN